MPGRNRTQRTLHPAVSLLAFVCMATLAAGGSVALLPLLIAGCLIMLAVPANRRAQAALAGRHAWRLRWLFLALLICYAWTTPGEPVWAGLSLPTWPGLAAAAKQGARLATTVLAFVALPGALAPEDLVAGILGLLPARGPARAPMQKFALRLALTMRYVEHLGSQARWRELFQPGTLLPEVGVIELHLRRWRAGEVLLAGTMLGATLILLLH